MRNLILAFIFCIPLVVSAQKGDNNYNVISDGIVKLYNDNKYTEIYSLYSPMLKKFQSPDESKKYLDEIKGKYGKISNKKFVKFQQNYGIFECQAEKGKVNLRISLDEQKRLVAFNFGPQ
ncbi:DUF3887 domain-containing protein [Membranihabitans maritimus]|uniref:DUF3887 domain-containing protein n=1 Tax=Membranihabitans maritimus TaxID=2904244 RepID=UPI001F37C9E8|nr:DUF3887 domain-containing protein [Membranihabitans maritimus]